MSPLWHDEVTIHLAPRKVVLVRRARGLRRRVVATTEVAVPAGRVGDLGPALASLAEVLTDTTWHGAEVRAVVTDQPWVRFAVVPWPATRLDGTARLTQARYLLEDMYGDAVANWEVTLADTPPGRAYLACAMPATLRGELEDTLGASHLRLVSLQPQLIASFNHWRRRLSPDDAWFVTADEASVSALHVSDGAPDRVHMARLSGDLRVELERLHALGRLTRVVVAPGRMYVDAPALMRARARATAGVEWLEEEDAAPRAVPPGQASAGRRPPPQVRLDFVAPVHETRFVGAALCVAGLTAAVALGLAFNRELAERSRLEAALAIRTPPHRGAPTAEAQKVAAESATVERELAVPWTRLLAELEAASEDTMGSVSLLAVEPDAAKRLVHITAEVRTLPDALAYLERLQRSAVLRYPMLESHERRKHDPQHPLRIKLSAEWRT